MKPLNIHVVIAFVLVAPYAGAWIETFKWSSHWRLGQVAPYAGAWIETTQGAKEAWEAPSPPTRGRGLKLQGTLGLPGLYLVAPYAGAWIETLMRIRSAETVYVAPYAGAWIETKV